MPVVFLMIILTAGITFFTAKKVKKPYRIAVHFCMSALVFISSVYQLICIAKYIDIAGERIANILGSFWWASLWGGLLLITIQLILLLLELIAKMREER